MYSLDFLAIHEYLFPRQKGGRGLAAVAGLPAGKGVVPEVNPDSPRAGVFLATEAIFNLSGLLVGVFVRNVFSDRNERTGVKVCLKLVFQRREAGGRYIGFTEQGAVSIELGMDELPEFLAVLAGDLREKAYQLPNSDKTLLIRGAHHRADGMVYLQMHQGMTFLGVLMSRGDVARVRLLGIAVLRILYPDIAEDVLLQVVTARPAAGAHAAMGHGTGEEVATTATQGASLEAGALPASQAGQAVVLAGIVINPAGDRPLGHGKRKALWAVGKKWGKNDQVVRALQGLATDGGAEALINAANQGNFAPFEEAAALHASGELKA